jgi:uncharacterized protein involved in exopolysaccharide biosynthesis
LENQEINLQELYFKLKSLFRLIFKNKFVFILIIISFVAIGYQLRAKAKYEASTSIYVSSGKGGGIMSLAASFGVGSQGGITNDEISGIAQSQDIKNHVLRQQAKINGKDDYMINHFIKYLKLDVVWKEKKQHLLNLDFNIKGQTQDSLYIILSRHLDKIINVNQGPTGDVIITITSKNEGFSFHTNKFMITYLKDFFKKLETNSDKNIIKILKSKKDSIQNELYLVESEYALVFDKNVNVVKSRGHIKMKQLERKLLILNSLQGEIVKNLELTEYNYASYTMPLKCIDEPKFPLKRTQQSFIINVIISTILGFIFAFAIVILRHLIKKFESNI